MMVFNYSVILFHLKSNAVSLREGNIYRIFVLNLF